MGRSEEYTLTSPQGWEFQHGRMWKRGYRTDQCMVQNIRAGNLLNREDSIEEVPVGIILVSYREFPEYSGNHLYT
jgi:hypothetical protein